MSEQLTLLQKRGFFVPEEHAPVQGIHYDMPMAEYMKICAMSKSNLFPANRNPHYFLHKLVEREKEDPTEVAAHFAVGHAIHAACLEPHTFDGRFAIAPAVNKRTKDGKATLQKFIAEATLAGKEVLTAEQYEQVMGMSLSFTKHERASDILRNGEAEVSIVDYDESFECFRKCRLDWFIDNDIVVDLKSIGRMADGDSVVKQIYDLGYYVQAAMYVDIASKVLKKNIKDFIFIFIESSPPYEVGLYRVGPLMMELGSLMYKCLMSSVIKSMQSGSWPHYNNDKIVGIEFKPWMEKQIRETISNGGIL